MSVKQNPTNQQNLHQWELYKTAPRERRRNAVSETETIFGEAPSGAHEAEPRWVIWREFEDINGRIQIEYAQGGINTLRWIYNTTAFDPVPDLTGKPYDIILDNQTVFDGMGAGLPVANISVLDIDDTAHNITIVDDPTNHFQVVGSVLVLADAVQLSDIAYPLKLRATDSDGNSYDEWFTISVADPAPAPIPEIGEINLHEALTIVSGGTSIIMSYTVPALRGLRLRLVDMFGENRGKFRIELNSEEIAKKGTYYTRYETQFDFDNFELDTGDVLNIYAENVGPSSAEFTARLRGYQYAK